MALHLVVIGLELIDTGLAGRHVQLIGLQHHRQAERRAGQRLAIGTVTDMHTERFTVGPVPDRTTCAAACVQGGYFLHRESLLTAIQVQVGVVCEPVFDLVALEIFG